MSIKTPQDVANRNALRRIAKRVYEDKRESGLDPDVAWAEVMVIASKAVEAWALQDIMDDTAKAGRS